MQIALREVSGWLDEVIMPVGSYAGSGRFGGDANVRGRSMPRLRGTALNLTPVLIDAVNLVYQISDGPGSVTALYEGGFAGGIAFSGTVDDLYASPPPPGTWQMQSSSGGLFVRLGTKPVYAITVDAAGDFPSGAAPRTVLPLLRQMLIEDLTMPAQWLAGSWEDSREAGWYWDGSQAVTGRQVVNTWLSGLGIRLVPSHEARLRRYVCRCLTIRPIGCWRQMRSRHYRVSPSIAVSPRRLTDGVSGTRITRPCNRAAAPCTRVSRPSGRVSCSRKTGWQHGICPPSSCATASRAICRSWPPPF
ncbi:hypothetical protein [Asaia prunellae]|uniref:hypothetical protein n=1 Tax=Asaia prunellae TaxID=610245 RepID=UPI000683D7BE|nr:hypothetical protein [Asaia prunellae]